MDGTVASRRHAGADVWVIRIGLVLGAFALLWYGTRLLSRWQLVHTATFSFMPLRWWSAVSVFVIAGMVVALAARFPFPHGRYAWGRLVIAAALFVPAIHLTLFLEGWTHPTVIFHWWWFDNTTTAQLSAVLAGAALGCGFGARKVVVPAKGARDLTDKG